MTDKLTIADYPMAEVRPERVRGARGKTLDDITLDSVVAGDVAVERDVVQRLAASAPDAFGPDLGHGVIGDCQLVCHVTVSRMAISTSSGWAPSAISEVSMA